MSLLKGLLVLICLALQVRAGSATTLYAGLLGSFTTPLGVKDPQCKTLSGQSFATYCFSLSLYDLQGQHHIKQGRCIY